MKKIITWFLMLNKRLFKKPGFIAILLLVPFITLAVTTATKQESGVLHIVLAAEGGGDQAAREMIDFLDKDTDLILFTVADSPEAAKAQVLSAKADAAWIFPAETDEAIARFLKDMDEDNAFIHVYQREQTTMLALSTEKIGQAVFPHVSDDIYLNFIRKNVPSLDSVSDEVLLDYYQKTLLDVELFAFDNAETQAAKENGYLAGPVRGLLSVLVVLGGLAAAIYFYKDEDAGTFAMLPISRRRFVAGVSQQSAILWVALASLLALFVSGQWVGFGLETAAMAIYVVAVAGFCTLLRRISGSGRMLSALAPVVVVLLIAICPVFFQQTAFRFIQVLLPTYYYLNSVYNPMHLLYMAAVAPAYWGLSLLAGRLGRKI